MAGVKPGKSSVGAVKKRKHRTSPTQCDQETAGMAQALRRKEVEERAALALFDQAQRLDAVAASTHETDTRDTVREVVQDLLAHAEPVRATIASKILGVDEKTVRAWVKEGLLSPVRDRARLMLEAERLYAVATLVQDLRRAGRTRNLAEAVWRRLQDGEFAESDQLADSLRQMEQGEGRPWREIKAEWGSKNSELTAGED
ncbi:MerR family transcriptional regulator [Streptosporangium sp. CA-135522]|uniref:MerR family transcriptional regulator n=1 Tax=Streptosporangium sp. CA-135522 TaxID=3240072 RepID=UPI003D8C9635